MKKKLFGGLAALALALAPAAAAHADYQSSDELHGSLDSYLVDPGATVTYTAPAGAYDANETVKHTLTGVNGHTATTVSLRTDVPAATTAEFSKSAEADGSHTFAFVMPTQAGAEYTFEALKADGTVWDTFVVTVYPQTGEGEGGTGNGGGTGDNVGAGSNNAGAGSGGNGGGLAMTGSDIAIAGIAGSAVLLVGAGVVLMLVRRRRRTAEAAAA